jgi:hypothetical protein
MKVFIAHCVDDRDLVESVVALLCGDGHEVLDPSKLEFTRDTFSEISAAIRSADAFIAVAGSGSPNIFYELGLAAGANVPTLVAARPNALLPGDLASVPYVLLTGDVLRDAQSIARRVKELPERFATKVEKFPSVEATLQATTQDPAVLESLTGLEFERLVAELFTERGYKVEPATQARDSGIDFVLKSPKDGMLVLVQVKKFRKQSRVSVESVRQVLDAVSAHRAPLGMLISPSGFTAAAAALAAGTPLLLRTLDEVLAARSYKDLFLETVTRNQT